MGPRVGHGGGWLKPPASGGDPSRNRLPVSKLDVPGVAFRSRWTRFLTDFASGTLWKNNRGPSPAGSLAIDRFARSASDSPAFKSSARISGDIRPSRSPGPRPKMLRLDPDRTSRRRHCPFSPRTSRLQTLSETADARRDRKARRGPTYLYPTSQSSRMRGERSSRSDRRP